MTAQIHTRDPVIAVAIRDIEALQLTSRDHEDRLRPLESLAAKVALLAFLGSGVGAILVQILFQLVK